MHNNLQKRTIAEIKSKYEKDVSPWLLAFSGGKDSSAVLKLLLQAMACTADHRRSVYIVFCDTGVENPLVADFARYAFRQVNSFAECNNLPASTHILN